MYSIYIKPFKLNSFILIRRCCIFFRSHTHSRIQMKTHKKAIKKQYERNKVGKMLKRNEDIIQEPNPNPIPIWIEFIRFALSYSRSFGNQQPGINTQNEIFSIPICSFCSMRTNGGRTDWYINHNKWRRTFNFQAVAWVSSLFLSTLLCFFIWKNDCNVARIEEKKRRKTVSQGSRIKCYERLVVHWLWLRSHNIYFD